ncbi:DNA polymerase clamp loader subunit A [Mangrovicoccus ximenensis]|uniref:DNA polymerase clamp loader subunit A n=1 Tax=Mangrovicoccus ximenensis TaxID=1911570 RepID=UPI0013750758
MLISDPQAHYDFLFYSIPKRKRFAKWAKEEKHDFEQIIVYIMEKFCYNRKTAIHSFLHTKSLDGTTMVTVVVCG